MKINNIVIKPVIRDGNSLFKISLKRLSKNDLLITFLKYKSEISVFLNFTNKELSGYSFFDEIDYCESSTITTPCLKYASLFYINHVLRAFSLNPDTFYYYYSPYNTGKIKRINKEYVFCLSCGIDIPLYSPYSKRPISATILENLKRIPNNVSNLLLKDCEVDRYEEDPLFEVFSYSVLKAFPEYPKDKLFELIMEKEEAVDLIRILKSL